MVAAGHAFSVVITSLFVYLENLEVEGFCSWRLKVRDFLSFIYFHILKETCVRKSSIFFRS